MSLLSPGNDGSDDEGQTERTAESTYVRDVYEKANDENPSENVVRHSKLVAYNGGGSIQNADNIKSDLSPSDANKSLIIDRLLRKISHSVDQWIKRARHEKRILTSKQTDLLRLENHIHKCETKLLRHLSTATSNLRNYFKDVLRAVFGGNNCIGHCNSKHYAAETSSRSHSRYSTTQSYGYDDNSAEQRLSGEDRAINAEAARIVRRVYDRLAKISSDPDILDAAKSGAENPFPQRAGEQSLEANFKSFARGLFNNVRGRTTGDDSEALELEKQLEEEKQQIKIHSAKQEEISKRLSKRKAELAREKSKANKDAVKNARNEAKGLASRASIAHPTRHKTQVLPWRTSALNAESMGDSLVDYISDCRDWARDIYYIQHDELGSAHGHAAKARSAKNSIDELTYYMNEFENTILVAGDNQVARGQDLLKYDLKVLCKKYPLVYDFIGQPGGHPNPAEYF